MKTANYAEDELPFVRSVSHPVHNSHDTRFANYKDAIAVFDISPILRFFGIWRWQSGRTSLWIVKDICGVICVLLTWLLLVFAEYVMWMFILLPSKDRSHSFVNGIIFQGFTCLAALSHLRAMFTDPGSVPRGNATKENIARFASANGQVIYRCPKCNSIKPNRAHHCSVCRRCIRKMDHHCPWINNCVGENNQKFFILFTLYICIISIHAFYLTVRHLVVCSGSDSKECSMDSPVLTTVLTILLLFESVLFSIFTGIMFGSQLWSVWTDTTGIEHVKRESHMWLRKSGWQSVKTVFGYQFSYRWFSPLHSGRPIYKSPETYDYDYSV